MWAWTKCKISSSLWMRTWKLALCQRTNVKSGCWYDRTSLRQIRSFWRLNSEGWAEWKMLFLSSKNSLLFVSSHKFSFLFSVLATQSPHWAYLYRLCCTSSKKTYAAIPHELNFNSLTETIHSIEKCGQLNQKKQSNPIFWSPGSVFCVVLTKIFSSSLQYSKNYFTGVLQSLEFVKNRLSILGFWGGILIFSVCLVGPEKGLLIVSFRYCISSHLILTNTALKTKLDLWNVFI